MDADDLLRAAHDATYRFPAGFPGFTARLHTHAGQTGTMAVRHGHDVGVDLPETAPDAGWVRTELSSMVTHRWSNRYEEGDGRWPKESFGDLVALVGDPLDSAYRVRDGQITQVHRTSGAVRFAIVVHNREPACDGRQLPVCFTAFHWALEPDGTPGRLVRADHYRDGYALVDGVHLPARREVTSATDTGLVTRYVELTDHVVPAG